MSDAGPRRSFETGLARIGVSGDEAEERMRDTLSPMYAGTKLRPRAQEAGTRLATAVEIAVCEVAGAPDGRQSQTAPARE